jgi:hypothetical protein
VPAEELGGLEAAWIQAAVAAQRLSGRRALDEQPVGDLDVSVDEFLSPLKLGPATRDLIAANLTPFFGDTGRASVLHFLERMSGYGGRPWALRSHHASTFVHGSTQLLHEMLEDTKPEVRLSAPVTHIVREAGRVTVTTADGKSTTARACVLAVPKTALVMDQIEVTPPLDEAKRRIIGSSNLSQAYKIHFIVENVPGPIHCIGFPAPLCVIWTLAELSPGRYLCVGAGSASGDGDDPIALETAAAGVRRYLPDARVVASDAHDWSRDRWTGGVSTLRAAGQWHGSRSTLLEPEGRLVFAGADIARSPFVNLLDAAVQSGHEAADRVSLLIGTWSSLQRGGRR